MAKDRKRGIGITVARRSYRDIDTQFYRGYDANFLYNKAIALRYATQHANKFKEDLESSMELDTPIGQWYFSSLSAELHFTEMHQFETFFSLLVAVFQNYSHWVYLTGYENQEMKNAITSFIKGDISAVTNGICDNDRAFIQSGLYCDGSPGDDEDARVTWDKNLDNAVRLIRRMAQRFIDADDYMAYKHGLRVLPISSTIELSLAGTNEQLDRPVFTATSAHAIQFLRLKDIGEGGKTIHSVHRHFDPDDSFTYIGVMRNMLRTIQTTRLAKLTGTETQLVTVTQFSELDEDDFNNVGAQDFVLSLTT